MANHPKKKSRVVLSYEDDESDNDELIGSSTESTSAKKLSSGFKFKRRSATNSSAGRHAKVDPDNADIKLEPESDDDELSVKIIRRSRKPGRLDEPQIFPSSESANKAATITEVLNRYGTISEYLEPQKKVSFKSDEENEEDDGYTLDEVKDSIPVILDSFQVQEIKDRRYRKQLDQGLRDQQIQDAKDDYDDEFHFKTNNRSLGDEDDMEGVLLDQDERYTDGRLAVGEKEQEVQKHLKKLEIEEALYNVELASSENEHDSHLPDPADGTHDSVNLGIALGLDLNEGTSKLNLQTVPDYNTQLSSMKTEIKQLSTLLESSKLRQRHLIDQLSMLTSERALF